jgi:stage III sporulation protein AH
MGKKKIWILGLLLVGLVTYFFVTGLNKEMSRIEIVPDEELLRPMLADDLGDPSKWKIDDPHAFFVEYRLERDRVRAQELEMLSDMINNQQVGEDQRHQAEEQVLSLIDLMEKELIVENMIKAQGYSDALLFSGKDIATVMLYTESLSESDFLRISDTVAAVTGTPREEVQVIQHK